MMKNKVRLHNSAQKVFNGLNVLGLYGVTDES